MSFEHISAPLARAIETIAANYVKGPTMFDKSQLPDIELREKKAALWEAWVAAEEGEAAEAAQAAYEACEGPHIESDGMDGVVRCAACGAPLFDGDETVEDWKTGESFLRVAVGIPPRAILPDVETEAAE